MNDRYGVDPSAAATVLELAGLLNKFRPEEGRFIVDFPFNWSAHAAASLSNATDLERARMIELLRRAKRSLLPTKQRYFTELPWAKNAERLEEVHGRIGPAGSTPPCRALVDVLTDPDGLRDCRGGHIPRTADAYAEVARPLFQISRKVVLIDPHFHLRYEDRNSKRQLSGKRYRLPFTKLLQVAKAERKVEVFKLVVSPIRALATEDGGAVFREDINKIDTDLSGAAVEFEYDWINENNRQTEQHARYLLGNECGLKFDWGFDVADHASTNHVEWIGRAALEPLLKRFM